MEARLIINILKLRVRTKKEYPLWMAINYRLYEDGYKSSQIASALGSSCDNVKYTHRAMTGLLQVNDEMSTNALMEIDSHEIRMEPYYVKNGHVMEIKANLFIDNIKLETDA